MLGVFQAGQAQQSTNSPYSSRGLGSLAPKTSAANRAMGGITAGICDPFYINTANPASYTAVPPLTFIFDMGVSYANHNFESQSSKQRNSNVALNYLNMAFPITSWWGGSFGMQPYSYVGHRSQSSYLNPDGYEVNSEYNGSGGINQVHFGTAFEFLNNFSLGINGYYRFGAINNESSVGLSYQPHPDYSSTSTIYATYDSLIIKGFSYQLGLQYRDTIGEINKENPSSSKFWVFNLGATFSPNQDLNTSQTYRATLKYNLLSSQYVSNLRVDEDIEKDINIPYSYSLGFTAHNQNYKWLLGLDYYYQNWSTGNYPEQHSNTKFTDSYGFSGGMQLIPDPGAMSYWKNMAFRLGAHYNQDYLNIQDHQIMDYGLSLGFGFPFRSKSNSLITTNYANLSIEAGQRGTTADGLIKESYIIGTFSLSLRGVWFRKFKFD